jgi:hypothetical protein
MTKLMRMELRDARPLAAAAQHLYQPAVGHLPLRSQPHRRCACGRVSCAHSHVAVHGLPSLRTARHGPRPHALPEDDDDVEVEIHVLDLKPATSPRRQPVSMKVLRIAASRRSSNLVPSHAFNKRRNSSSPTTGTRSSGTCGGDILAMGNAEISSSSTAYLKNCCRDRYRTAAVAGRNSCSCASMNDPRVHV